jgi:tetratricopeptide (TPR) repeat protein
VLPEASELLPLIDPQILGRRLHAARLAAGLSAADLGLGGEALDEVEGGLVRPSAALLEVVAERAGTSVDVLVTGLPRDVLMDIQGELDLAEFSLSSSDTSTALSTVDRILKQLTEATAPPLEREARRIRATALEGAGDLAGAIAELILVAEPPHADVDWLKDLMSLSRCYREIGDLDRAIAVGEDHVSTIRSLGLDGHTEALQLAITTAGAYIFHGDLRHATRMCKRVARDAEERGLPVARASALWNRSLALQIAGEVDAALSDGLEALMLFETHDDTRNLGRLRTHVAGILLDLQPPDAAGALSMLERARTELEWTTAGAVDVAGVSLAMANALRLLGDLDAAAATLGESISAAPADAPELRAWQGVLAGRIAADHGDLDEARRQFQDAVSRLYARGTDAEIGQLWFELGDILTALGESRLAADAYRSAGVAQGLRPPG